MWGWLFEKTRVSPYEGLEPGDVFDHVWGVRYDRFVMRERLADGSIVADMLTWPQMERVHLRTNDTDAHTWKRVGRLGDDGKIIAQQQQRG